MVSDLKQLFGAIDIYLFDQILRGNIVPGMRVLDAGCGSGRNLLWFMKNGFEVMALDPDPRAIEATWRLADEHAAHVDRDAIRLESLEKSSFDSGCADVVVCNAVLHFAAHHRQFDAQLDAAWRLLAPGGLFFARLASSIGLEDQLVPTADGRFTQPDGSERYLVDLERLLSSTRRLGGQLVDPIKTTNVQNLRCMSTWVVKKSS